MQYLFLRQERIGYHPVLRIADGAKSARCFWSYSGCLSIVRCEAYVSIDVREKLLVSWQFVHDEVQEPGRSDNALNGGASERPCRGLIEVIRRFEPNYCQYQPSRTASAGRTSGFNCSNASFR